MLEDIMAVLVCPVCSKKLDLAEKIARCEDGHSFDVAKQGYLNLLPGRAKTGTADTSEMVDARHRFLESGHYAPIADAVAAAVVRFAPPGGPVIDIGAGTGWYLARVLDTYDGSGLALDISKYAARRAARAHPRAGAVVADAWTRLPVADGAVAAILDIFSPRNPSEFRRVLRPGGVVVVVVPQADHLAPLVDVLGLLGVGSAKLEDLDAKFADSFERVELADVRYSVPLVHHEVLTVVGMGPSSLHVDPHAVAKAASSLPQPADVTVAVSVVVYRAI